MKLSKHRALEAIRQLLKLHKTRSASRYSRGNMVSALNNLVELGYVIQKGTYGERYEITPEGNEKALEILASCGIELKS